MNEIWKYMHLFAFTIVVTWAKQADTSKQRANERKRVSTTTTKYGEDEEKRKHNFEACILYMCMVLRVRCTLHLFVFLFNDTHNKITWTVYIFRKTRNVVHTLKCSPNRIKHTTNRFIFNDIVVAGAVTVVVVIVLWLLADFIPSQKIYM